MTSHGYHREQHQHDASEDEFKETYRGQAGLVRILEKMGVLENIIVGNIKSHIAYANICDTYVYGAYVLERRLVTIKESKIKITAN